MADLTYSFCKWFRRFYLARKTRGIKWYLNDDDKKWKEEWDKKSKEIAQKRYDEFWHELKSVADEWTKLGYDRDGSLIQRHKETGEIRTLNKWCEFWREDGKHK